LFQVLDLFVIGFLVVLVSVLYLFCLKVEYIQTDPPKEDPANKPFKRRRIRKVKEPPVEDPFANVDFASFNPAFKAMMQEQGFGLFTDQGQVPSTKSQPEGMGPIEFTGLPQGSPLSPYLSIL